MQNLKCLWRNLAMWSQLYFEILKARLVPLVHSFRPPTQSNRQDFSSLARHIQWLHLTMLPQLSHSIRRNGLTLICFPITSLISSNPLSLFSNHLGNLLLQLKPLMSNHQLLMRITFRLQIFILFHKKQFTVAQNIFTNVKSHTSVSFRYWSSTEFLSDQKVIWNITSLASRFKG